MTSSLIPEWAKVKIAALTGLGVPLVFVEHVGPVLDVLIKCGQFGVAVVTILYIFAKWRKARRK